LLDGEIIAIDDEGRISFNLLQHYRSNAKAILFYAFDVLVFRGKSLHGAPLEKRRTVLAGIFADLRSPSPLAISETLDASQRN